MTSHITKWQPLDMIFGIRILFLPFTTTGSIAVWGSGLSQPSLSNKILMALLLSLGKSREA